VRIIEASRLPFSRDTEDRSGDALYLVASQHIERHFGFGHLLGLRGRQGCQERPHCTHTSVVSSIWSVKPHPSRCNIIRKWKRNRKKTASGSQSLCLA